MIRLPGTEHLPLSPRIVTDGTYFEPFSAGWLERHPRAYDIAVLVKDGRIFGGKDFRVNLEDEKKTIFIFNDVIGGWARIPIDEIVGIRKGYVYQ